MVRAIALVWFEMVRAIDYYGSVGLSFEMAAALKRLDEKELEFTNSASERRKWI